MMKRGCRGGELKAEGGWSGKMNGTADKEENEAFFHIFSGLPLWEQGRAG
jgi:hypothetical protein